MRGGAREAPEATLEAALEQGAGGSETAPPPPTPRPPGTRNLLGPDGLPKPHGMPLPHALLCDKVYLFP